LLKLPDQTSGLLRCAICESTTEKLKRFAAERAASAERSRPSRGASQAVSARSGQSAIRAFRYQRTAST